VDVGDYEVTHVRATAPRSLRWASRDGEDDTLRGGRGNDTIDGGGGTDHAKIDSALGVKNNVTDTIEDVDD
jgi:Ca2+-binding RTX toxin-like protein